MIRCILFCFYKQYKYTLSQFQILFYSTIATNTMAKKILHHVTNTLHYHNQNDPFFTHLIALSMATITLNKSLFCIGHQCQYRQQWKYLSAMHIVEHNHTRQIILSSSSYSMALITQFDDLPDLVIIDLFSYLTSIDVLWTFANLNNRLRKLVHERNFFRHVNLSSARLSIFDTLLTRLPLNQIETLLIDIGASTLQLSRWPDLPSLTTLRLYGLRDFEDATSFILRHSASLVRLTLGTNDRFMLFGFAGHILRPRGRLPTLVQNILPHLSSLRSLDLGQDTGFGLTNWHITTIQSPLNYLRVSMEDIPPLYHLMSAKALSTTLEQLHVTLRNLHWIPENILPEELELPPMMNLHTFTLIQSIFSENRIEWSTIESLTAPKVMPVLRRVKLAIFITDNDLNGINGSLLFTDDRRIDVQFAFIIDTASIGVQRSHQIPRGSRFHPRQVVGVTCIWNWLSAKYKESTDLNCYFDIHPRDYDVWYTLPWAFEPFFDLSQPIQYITKTEVFALPPSYTSTVSSSRLRTLHISENELLPSMITMPHVVRLDRIDTVHLSFHDWPISLNLPALRHVTLINNLVALKTFSSFPSGIRSIQILFRSHMPNFVSANWSVLRSLSALPMLNSFHIVFDDINTGLDEPSCQIIAETVPMLAHFGIYFRSQSGRSTSNDHYQDVEFDFNANNLGNFIIVDEVIDSSLLESLSNMYRISITEIHRRILCLSFHTKPLIVVEEEGYGLTVWS